MSFFVADNKIAINQESIAVPSINGLSYNPGQLIELRLDPAQVKFFQPQNSYLQFNVKLQMPSDAAGEVMKLMLDSHIGAQALIRDIRIHDGNNNALLEEIVGYNIATMNKYDYHCNESLRNKRALVEGAGARITPHGQLGTAFSNQNTAMNFFTDPEDDSDRESQLKNASYTNVKVCLPLNTGIFGNDKVFPSMLTNGLRISILLEDSQKAIRMLEGAMLNRKKKLNPFIHSSNGCLTTGAFTGAATGATAYTTIFLTQDNGYVEPDNLPFAVGERIGILRLAPAPEIEQVFYTDTKPVIQKIEFIAASGATESLLKLTTSSFQMTTGVANNTNASHIIFSDTAHTTYNTTYQVSDVNLVVQSLDMGANYEADMLRRMREGGTINYDFLSLTNYRYSQLAGDIVAQIQIPLENRRMKSIICIPVDSSAYAGNVQLTASGTYSEETGLGNQDRCGLAGISDNIQSYQFTYGGRQQPARLVSTAKTSSKTSVSQQHLIELEKALTSAGISGQSMLEFNRNFCIGRAVAVQNGIYDGRNRQFSLQVNYGATAPTKNKLWNSFVYHIRRMTIAGDSISVEV